MSTLQHASGPTFWSLNFVEIKIFSKVLWNWQGSKWHSLESYQKKIAHQWPKYFIVIINQTGLIRCAQKIETVKIQGFFNFQILSFPDLLVFRHALAFRPQQLASFLKIKQRICCTAWTGASTTSNRCRITPPSTCGPDTTGKRRQSKFLKIRLKNSKMDLWEAQIVIFGKSFNFNFIDY